MYDAQAHSTCRAMPSAALVPIHRPALADLTLVHRQAAIHSACVDLVTLRVRQPLQQVQECGFAPVFHLNVLPPIAQRVFQHSSPYPARITRVAPPNAHISSSDMTLTLTCCRRARSAHSAAVTWGDFLFTNRWSQALTPRTLDIAEYLMPSECVAIACRLIVSGQQPFGSEAEGTLAATVGLLAAREPALGNLLKSQGGHWHIVAINSLHRGHPCYKYDLCVNFKSVIARLLVLRMPAAAQIADARDNAKEKPCGNRIHASDCRRDRCSQWEFLARRMAERGRFEDSASSLRSDTSSAASHYPPAIASFDEQTPPPVL